jgi:hypothetical protein
MTTERLADILPPADAALIADETDAARADIVPPHGWIVVTGFYGPVAIAASAVTFVDDGDGGGSRIHLAFSAVLAHETPAEVAVLIAAAQGEPEPAHDDAVIGEAVWHLSCVLAALQTQMGLHGNVEPAHPQSIIGLAQSFLRRQDVRAALALYDARKGTR